MSITLIDKHPFKTRIRRVYKNFKSPRRIHLFSIGAPKTGTTSVARIFEKDYRAKHEPGYNKVCRVLVEYYEGKLTSSEIINYLRKRDLHNWLEVESSHPLGFLCYHLFNAFPNAKFLVTYRDVRAWLNSIINQHINEQRNTKWSLAVRDIYFGLKEYSKHDSILQAYNVYPVSGYLHYWYTYYKTLLNTERTSIQFVNIDRLEDELDRVNEYAGSNIKNCRKYHYHINKKDWRLLDKIENGYLDEMIDIYCSEVYETLEAKKC